MFIVTHNNFNRNKFLEALNMLIENYSSFQQTIVVLCLKNDTRCNLFFEKY